MRLVTAFCLVVAIFAFGGAHAEPSDDSLRVYAAHILHGSAQEQSGYGIYLGKGLVITVAHVANSNELGVRIAGLNLPAHTVKKSAFELDDLALLSIDEEKLPISLRLRRISLCQRPPWVGESVTVAIPESTARSQIISPLVLPPVYRKKYATVIRDVATTGNSGSGVFDAGRKCLLGIMSRKFTTRSIGPDVKEKDIAKYFVPASTITAFMPTEVRF